MVNFFILSNCDKHDEMQLLAKFEKILFIGFRAALNFWKFNVALNLYVQNFFES